VPWPAGRCRNDTEQVVLSGYRIDYCDHCEICDKEESCSIGDDFWPIYEKMKAADAIIFFTSVTYGMMNPKLAAFMQRAGRICPLEWQAVRWQSDRASD